MKIIIVWSWGLHHHLIELYEQGCSSLMPFQRLGSFFWALGGTLY